VGRRVKVVEVVALRLGPFATVRVTVCFSLARQCIRNSQKQCVSLIEVEVELLRISRSRYPYHWCTAAEQQQMHWCEGG
jgi:hypothetical protein